MSDSVIKQMEDFAAKLLSDEISVYNKRKKLNSIKKLNLNTRSILIFFIIFVCKRK